MIRPLLLCALLAVLAPRAEAGPPAICWPIEIDGAESLPWGKAPCWEQPFDTARDYDVAARLVPDVLRLLASESPLPVRMETLRRATVYVYFNAHRRQDVALELLERLEARARALEAEGAPGTARAWFDVGYLSECYRQLGERDAQGREYDGYARMLYARRIGLWSPLTELALGIVAYGAGGRDPWAHFAAAASGAKPGDVIERYLRTYLPDVLEQARARSKREPA